LVVTMRASLVLTFVIVSVAPGMSDPAGSATVPVIDPVAWAFARPGRKRAHAKRTEVAKYLSFKFRLHSIGSFETIQNLM
jgi:hypothetical protein